MNWWQIFLLVISICVGLIFTFGIIYWQIGAGHFTSQSGATNLDFGEAMALSVSTQTLLGRSGPLLQSDTSRALVSLQAFSSFAILLFTFSQSIQIK